MAAKYFVVLACLALSQASVVKRDAPSTPTVLEDIQKHAAEFQATFAEGAKQFVNSKDTQEFQKSLKDGADSLAQQITALSTSLQKAVEDANGKAKEVLEASQANIQKSADELSKAHPDVQAQASALRDKIAAAVQSTLEETQKLAKDLGANMEETNKKVAPLVAKAFEDFKKQTEAVQKKLHEAASKQ